MTVRSDSMRPLSPHQLRSDEKQEARGKPQRKLWLWGCVALLLTITALIIILILTVFQIKDPDIKVNSVTIKQIAFANITNGGLPSGLNITLVADVSVKNPNVASIKLGNSTSTIYYGGIVVGEGRIPAAVSKSKRTLRLNVSMDVIPKKLMAVPTFTTDLISGALNMSTYTRIQGKVKLLKSIKVTVVMKLNCTVTYKISSQTAQSHCKLRH
ncbi:late embryogenesis abundant protein At1g64065-like [Pistacia vera]|uniref:late embryogenesis abundant protein At1g64065-like n=1 Tax=Pistacia vera TaxID=55513 RepID=UPI001262EFDE|nr:late embryogenesis abundant protein At1g64065-like [Pistacia vera]